MDSLISEFKSRLKNGNGNHLYLNITLDELEMLGGAKKIVKFATRLSRGNLSISALKSGTINFVHVTTPNKIEAIKESGLIPITEGMYALGKGIYLADRMDLFSFTNLQMWVATHVSNLELSVVFGRFDGIYTKCIYPSNRQGFIVVSQTIHPHCFTKIEPSVNREEFLNRRLQDL
ncbi:hypothetical protein ABE354_23515 [Brevibacillus laterosporus]|uniref:hypothetical protein n=1 Tax=Brevibacillus laterosporus TaxID=1465 RepID=UPI003D1D353C